MKNITKTSIWATLQALGFVVITWKGYGKGCALQYSGIDINKQPFKSDIITIQPSKGKYWHIVGHYKELQPITVITERCAGQMITKEPSLTDFCNTYVSHSEILEIVSKLKTVRD